MIASSLPATCGDRAAEYFVRALHGDVLRFVTHLVDEGPFARAFGSLHRFEGRACARTRLLSIARRTVAGCPVGTVRSRARSALLVGIKASCVQGS